MLDERIAERATEEGDDLSRAAPFVAEALYDVANGRVVTRTTHEARADAVVAVFKG